MPTVDAVFGSLNVHRKDCLRTEHPACEDWGKVRKAAVLHTIKDQMKASVYAFQECNYDQAVDLTVGLGWGSARNPAFTWDENQSVIAYDRSKWRDVLAVQVSLASKAGETGDKNRRSVNWVLLEHLDTKARCWFGASHLETGNPDARIEQATVLARIRPFPTYPMVLGIDRNSYTTESGGPRDLLRKSGFTELVFDNPKHERSFNGFETPIYDGKCIDGIHSIGVTFRDGRLVSTAGTKGTDHSGLVANLTITN